MGRTISEIRAVCEKCCSYGSPYEREVALTVAKNGFKWTPRQEAIVCAGASFKGGSPGARYQSGDNSTEDDFFDG